MYKAWLTQKSLLHHPNLLNLKMSGICMGNFFHPCVKLPIEWLGFTHEISQSTRKCNLYIGRSVIRVFQVQQTRFSNKIHMGTCFTSHKFPDHADFYWDDCISPTEFCHSKVKMTAPLKQGRGYIRNLKNAVLEAGSRVANCPIATQS